MDDYYVILGCEKSASHEQLKEAYVSLIKQYHPDKSNNILPKSDASFIRIDKAWKTLREPESRKNYDEGLKQSEINDVNLLYGTFNLDQLSFDPQEQLYSYPCRCGGQYCVSKSDIDRGDSFLIDCDSCSFLISISNTHSIL